VKQLSLAAHNYADSFKKVPPLWLQNNATRDYVSLFFLLLPFVEQQNVYIQGTPSNPQVANGHYTRCGYFVRNDIIQTFICPSDPTYPDNIDNNGWASCNYAGNVMVFDPNAPGTIVTAMPDGTSNTVIFGHRYKLCDATILFQGGHTQGDWAAYPRDSALGYWSCPGFGYTSYVLINGKNANMSWQGWPDFTSSGKPTSGIPFQTAPLPQNCNFDVLVSPHAGVMIAGLGDGSVRTVGEGITTKTWYYACQPNDGQVLGSDWNQ
jgi:hypothetical protein